MTAAALIIAAALPGRGDAFDYVRNGGFEDGASGWTAWGAEVDAVDGSVIAADDGAMSGRIVAQAPSFVVRPTVATDAPPGAYTFSARVRGTATGTVLYLQVLWASEGMARESIALSDGPWTTLSGHFSLATAADLSLTIQALSAVPGEVVYVDDVRIDGAAPATRTPTSTATATETPTPEPTRTGTRTPTVTRTPAPTRTPSPTAEPGGIGAVLYNGGFETVDVDGVPAGWRKFGGSLAAVSAPVHSGGRAARFTSESSSTKWLYQTVTVEPGGWYAFGVWLLNDEAGIDDAFLRISWYDTPDGSGTTIGAADSPHHPRAGGAYQYVTTGAVQAPPDAHSARLRIVLAPRSEAAATIFVDDAEFGPASPGQATTAPAGDAPSGTDAPSAGEQGVLGESRRPRRARSAGAAASAVGGGAARVVINEVLYNPDGPGEDAASEWVELYNAGDAAVDLGGWSLGDAMSDDDLPALHLEPRSFALVAASDSILAIDPALRDEVVAVIGRIGNGLGNAGDRLLLRDAAGNLIDGVSWGADMSVLAPAAPLVPAGHSIERRLPGLDTDAGDDFVDNESPSPGRALEPVAGGAGVARAGSVEVVSGAPDRSYTWTAWVLAALAAGALAGAAVWQLAPGVLRRVRG